MTRRDRVGGLFWAAANGASAGFAIEHGVLWLAGVSATIGLMLVIRVALGER